MDILSYPIIGFGKLHKGKAFNKVPTPYLRWMANNFSDPYFKACASCFLRGDDAPEPEDCVYIHYAKDTEEIEINATYALMPDIKELSERRWDGDGKKRWMVPLHVYDELMKTFPNAHLSASLKEVLGDRIKQQAEMSGFIGRTESETVIEFDDPELHLYPFQNVAVDFIEANAGRCMVAAEMGLGKTITTIGYMKLHPNHNTIIVCPAIMKNVWKDEIYKWLGIDAIVLSSRKPVSLSSEVLDNDDAWAWKGMQKDTKTGSGKCYIINYDILDVWADTLKSVSANLIIYDESHYLKNSKSNRTRAAKTLADSIPYTILLTGTPITNRPKDLFSQLNIIKPLQYPNFFAFAKKYCGAYQQHLGKTKFWNFDGVSNADELAARLQNSIVLRQIKAQCLPDLPDKIRQRVSIPILGEPEDIMELMRCKIPGAIDYIGEMLNTVDKLVVFCTHTEILEAIVGEFDALRIDGAVHDDFNEFQNDPDKHLLVCNSKAAGIGITLTAASHCVFCELPWTPAELEQAEDRLHRVGTKRAVNYYYLVAEHPVDEHVADTIIDKKQVVTQIMLDEMASDFKELKQNEM